MEKCRNETSKLSPWSKYLPRWGAAAFASAAPCALVINVTAKGAVQSEKYVIIRLRRHSYFELNQ